VWAKRRLIDYEYTPTSGDAQQAVANKPPSRAVMSVRMHGEVAMAGLDGHV